jgi:translation initiation factor eIF-2B subunit beta
MAQGAVIQAPGLSTFLKSLKTTPVDPSVEHFISYVPSKGP